jgi:hypothetical protein
MSEYRSMRDARPSDWLIGGFFFALGAIAAGTLFAIAFALASLYLFGHSFGAPVIQPSPVPPPGF